MEKGMDESKKTQKRFYVTVSLVGLLSALLLV